MMVLNRNMQSLVSANTTVITFIRYFKYPQTITYKTPALQLTVVNLSHQPSAPPTRSSPFTIALVSFPSSNQFFGPAFILEQSFDKYFYPLSLFCKLIIELVGGSLNISINEMKKYLIQTVQQKFGEKVGQ